MKRFDAHIHVGTWPEFGLRFELEDLKEMMSAYKIDAAVVTPALTGDTLIANASLQKQVRGIMNLYFFAWVQPGPWQNMLLVYLEQNLSEIRGLKFHASAAQTSITDRKMDGFLELADHAELPFLYHAGRTPISWPDRLMGIASSYSNIKFIIAHLGGNAYDRIVDTLRRWPVLPENVYVESSTARHPDLLVRAFEQWPGRVMYGSDLPFTDMRLNFDCLRYAGLHHNEEFMGGVLSRLLGEREPLNTDAP